MGRLRQPQPIVASGEAPGAASRRAMTCALGGARHYLETWLILGQPDAVELKASAEELAAFADAMRSALRGTEA